MKNLKKILSVVFKTTLLLTLFFCSDGPTNNNNNNNCPPISTDIVPKPPYNNPIWHPSNKFVGFNYTPLDSISYPYGKNCIGYQHFNYGSSGFWLINTDGTNKRRIFPYQLNSATWSPDGKWIAFVMNAQIYKMPFDINEEKFDTTRIEQLTFEGRNFFPTWSPDGKWIAFDSNNNSYNGMSFIWKMRDDGTQKTRIAYDPTNGEIRMPNWSRNNKVIHIRYLMGLGEPEIFGIDSNGNNTKRFTFDQNWDSNPKYSPDDSKIAFWSNGNIWLMDTTGVNLRQITTNRVDVNFGLPFSWSPEGKKIIYTKYSSSNWSYDNGALWIIDAGTGTEYQLTFNNEKR